MRRKIQIKGYTRTVKGKTVKVKPYSRMVGKDTGSAKPGDELRAKKEEKAAEEKKAPVYNTDPNAMTPSGMTRKEFDEAALRENTLRTYKAAPEFARKKMLADPVQGKIIREHLGAKAPAAPTATPKRKKRSLGDRLLRFADRLIAYGDKHSE